MQLAGGATFAGTLVIDAEDGGDADHPIEIGSYGDGRATIDAGDGDGVVVKDRGAAWIRDLVVHGSGVATSHGRGIALTTDRDEPVARVLIERCDVVGFHGAGIDVGAMKEPGGFHGVRIRDCDVSACGQAGIQSWGWIAKDASPRWAHADLVVERCTAHDNRGIPDKTDNHSGSGIVLGCVDGARIARCEAFANGADCNYPGGGPVGIWCWEARGVVIEECESHHNRTGEKSLDGGGFDLDGGAVGCEIRYCLSYQNDGAGYLLCQYAGARLFRDCRIHHCFSFDDGRAHAYGGVTTYGNGPVDIATTTVDHNTIIVHAPAAGPTSALVRIMGVPQAVLFTANALGAHDCLQVRIDRDEMGLTRFIGNGYAAAHGKFDVAIASTFAVGKREGLTLPEWRALDAERDGEHDKGLDMRAPGGLTDSQLVVPTQPGRSDAAPWRQLASSVDGHLFEAVIPAWAAWERAEDQRDVAVGAAEAATFNRDRMRTEFHDSAVDVDLLFDDWDGVTILRPEGLLQAPLRQPRADAAIARIARRDVVRVRIAAHVAGALFAEAGEANGWDAVEALRQRLAVRLRRLGCRRLIIAGLGSSDLALDSERDLGADWPTTWSEAGAGSSVSP